MSIVLRLPEEWDDWKDTLGSDAELVLGCFVRASAEDQTAFLAWLARGAGGLLDNAPLGLITAQLARIREFRPWSSVEEYVQRHGIVGVHLPLGREGSAEDIVFWLSFPSPISHPNTAVCAASIQTASAGHDSGVALQVLGAPTDDVTLTHVSRGVLTLFHGRGLLEIVLRWVAFGKVAFTEWATAPWWNTIFLLGTAIILSAGVGLLCYGASIDCRWAHTFALVLLWVSLCMLCLAALYGFATWRAARSNAAEIAGTLRMHSYFSVCVPSVARVLKGATIPMVEGGSYGVALGISILRAGLMQHSCHQKVAAWHALWREVAQAVDPEALARGFTGRLNHKGGIDEVGRLDEKLHVLASNAILLALVPRQRLKPHPEIITVKKSASLPSVVIRAYTGLKSWRWALVSHGFLTLPFCMAALMVAVPNLRHLVAPAPPPAFTVWQHQVAKNVGPVLPGGRGALQLRYVRFDFKVADPSQWLVSVYAAGWCTPVVRQHLDSPDLEGRGREHVYLDCMVTEGGVNQGERQLVVERQSGTLFNQLAPCPVLVISNWDFPPR